MGYEPERINGEDSVAEGFEKTNRNNWNLKTILNEWFNSIGEKLKNLGELIQALTKEVEKKADKTDIPTIPTSLPANGGNSNTVGGISPGYNPSLAYIPIVGGGVMEVGKIIDFHESSSSKDFDGRLALVNNYLYWDIEGKGLSKVALADGNIQQNLNAAMLNGRDSSYFGVGKFGGAGETCRIITDAFNIKNEGGFYINGVFMGAGVLNMPSQGWYFIKQIVHNNDWLIIQALEFTNPDAKWIECRKYSGKWQTWKEL